MTDQAVPAAALAPQGAELVAPEGAELTPEGADLALAQQTEGAPPRPGRLAAVAPYFIVYVIFQCLALAIWWRLLAGGLTSAIPAGSADPAQEVWFLAWLPHALGGGTNPFFGHTVFAPAGVDLLSNTSMELLGLLFAPVTVTAGPLAALDVATIIAPAASALAGFALCRRYAGWAPAAFVGGLVYGFGPFLAIDLRYSHLDLTWLVFPPLIFLVLDSLIVRGRRPVRNGAGLGGLVVLQFFVSTEMLAVTALMALAGLAVAALARPRVVVSRITVAAPGIAMAVGLAGALLAYPLWVVVAGPHHMSGPVWPGIGHISSTLAASVQPHGELARVAFISGGNGSYLGVGLLVVLAGGAVRYRRSAALRLSLALAVLAYIGSLGYQLHAGRSSLSVPMPAAVLGHLPIIDSLVPTRFGAMTDLFCAVALAVVLDNVRRDPALTGRRMAGQHRVSRPGRWAPLPVAALAGAVAVAPLLALPPWPYAAAAFRQPPALRTVSRALCQHCARPPVLAVFPDAPPAAAAEMVGQAEDRWSFSLADGYAIVAGPGARATESPPIDALWLVFAAASIDRLHLPLTATTRRSVRTALAHDRVDDVVVLPGTDGSVPVRRALVSVLGPPSSRVDGAAIWAMSAIRHPGGGT